MYSKLLRGLCFVRYLMRPKGPSPYSIIINIILFLDIVVVTGSFKSSVDSVQVLTIHEGCRVYVLFSGIQAWKRDELSTDTEGEQDKRVNANYYGYTSTCTKHLFDLDNPQLNLHPPTCSMARSASSSGFLSNY